MDMFKVGDKVDRVQGLRSFQKLEGGGPYTVTAVSPSARFIQINLNNHYGDPYPWDAQNFKLVEQDDPLPPAPESVRYNDEYSDRFAYKQTWLDVKQDDKQIYIETGQYGEYKGVGMVLSPDAALQLAHDLTRMAMGIKRRERAQSGE